MRTTDKHVFFWNEFYSQWHLADMVCPITNITFNSSEQYMMYNKAILFNDTETASKILATKVPKEQKALGKEVKNFEGEKWDEYKFQIVCNACMLKFTQNPLLLAALLKSEDKILVEASPYDQIWGIGMKENDPGVDDERNWKGENLLGQALMDTRTHIRNLLLHVSNLYIF